MAAWTCACGSQPPLSAANQNPGSCLDADVHHRLHSSAPAQEQHQLICRSPLQLSHSGDRGITYHSPARNLSRLPAQDSSRQSSPTAVLRPPSDHPHYLPGTLCLSLSATNAPFRQSCGTFFHLQTSSDPSIPHILLLPTPVTSRIGSLNSPANHGR